MDRVTIHKTTRNLAVVLAILVTTVACDGSSSNNSKKALIFVTPQGGELAGSSSVEFELMLPGGVNESDLQLSFDGAALDSSGFIFENSTLTGFITNAEDGSHELNAELPGSSKVAPRLLHLKPSP